MIAFEKKRISLLLSFFIILFLLSCSAERNLAREYIVSKDTIHVLLLQTKNIIKKNLKTFSDSLSDQRNDSIIRSNESIISSMKEDVFLNLLYSGLSDGLRNRNFKIYSEDSLNNFMKHDFGYIINLSQIEIEEFDTPDTVFLQRDSTIYYKAFLLNSGNINLWFEVSNNKKDLETQQVLFNSKTFKDEINTYYKEYLFSENATLLYNINKTTIDDLYRIVFSFGFLNAEYINDYFMNKYINERYNKNKTPIYFHYDKSQNKLSQAGYNRFIFM